MTTLDVLVGARKLIERPENWTQGAYARTRCQRPVGPQCANAACFCVTGAINRIAYAEDDPNVVDRVLMALERAIGNRRVIAWNDNSTHAEVLKGFDRAIARERAAC